MSLQDPTVLSSKILENSQIDVIIDVLHQSQRIVGEPADDVENDDQ